MKKIYKAHILYTREKNRFEVLEDGYVAVDADGLEVGHTTHVEVSGLLQELPEEVITAIIHALGQHAQLSRSADLPWVGAGAAASEWYADSEGSFKAGVQEPAFLIGCEVRP